jgi:hypothetical protein
MFQVIQRKEKLLSFVLKGDCMVKMLSLGIENAVAFEMSGKITKEDVTLILDDAKQKIEKYGDIVIWKQIESFEGIELDALAEEFKYLTEIGISNIKKVAIITDKTWVEKIVTIEDEIFKSIEIRCFNFEELVFALSFLGTQN